MRFGFRLPGPFFAILDRSTRSQARRNLRVQAHEQDIRAGNHTTGEDLSMIIAWFLRVFLGLVIAVTVLYLPFYFAWVGIAHVANDINPDLHWHQVHRTVANCNVTFGADYVPVTGYCTDGGNYEPVGWHY